MAEVVAYQREQATSPPEDRPPEVEDRPAGPEDRATAHDREQPPERADRDAPHPADGPIPARDHPRPAGHVGEDQGRARRPGAQPPAAGRPAHQRERVPRRHAEDRAAGPADPGERVDGEGAPRQRAGELAWVTQRLGRAQGSWAHASQRIQSIDRYATRLRREPLGRWVHREELGELRQERARQVYYAGQARARVEQLGVWQAEVTGHQAARVRWRAEHGLPPEQPASRAELWRAERARARAERAGGHPDRTVLRDRGERDPGRIGLAGLLGGPPRPGRRWPGRGGPASPPWLACTSSSSTSAPTPTPPGRRAPGGLSATTTAAANADRRRHPCTTQPTPWTPTTSTATTSRTRTLSWRGSSRSTRVRG